MIRISNKLIQARYVVRRRVAREEYLLRYLWAGPATLVGLVLAFALLRRGRATLIDGVIEAHSPLLAWALTRLIPLAGGAAAITLGHVVIGRSAELLASTRAHERVHVRQYEVWGPLFVPAYLIASVCAFVRGRHPYFDNRFEREACSMQRCHRAR
jgi:hypothetical protein